MATTYSKFVDRLFEKADGKGIPLSGTFELTSRCNLDCKMCYIHKRANDAETLREELSAEEWLSIAKEAKKHGMLFLLLTGGEPFLRSDFKKIYAECHEMGFLISINTNGTLITEEIVDFLKKYPPLRINITVYGASAETYERLCGNADSYACVHRAIHMLKEAGIAVKLNYSVTLQNVKDAAEVYQFARNTELPIQAATYMFPPVRACEKKECRIERLSPLQSAQAKWEYDQYRFSEEMVEIYVNELLEGRKNLDSLDECMELPTEKIRCRAGATTFWITYHGQMRPCGMMTEPSVNLKQKDFTFCWTQILEMRKKIMLPAKCTACKWKKVCEFCPAVCYAENGNYEVTPQYMCEKMEAYVDLLDSWKRVKEKI